MILEARSLAVSYGSREILRGIDIDVREGELVAIVGANGAGKTTLLRTLSGTVPKSHGEVLLEGRPIESFTRLEIARRLAVVPQDLPSAAGFSVREVVAMGRSPHQGTWMRSSERDRKTVDEALQRTRLVELADRPFDALSGGERKRATIAQALSQTPRVLLLDEPSAFLDLRHALDVFDLAREEVSRGVAVVAIVHDLSLASRFADRVALLAQGALAAFGPPAEVLDEDNLGKAFGVRIRRVRDPETGADAFAPVR
ncbi:MAG: ABC transporter ATP-binding protein [Polyangiales bacterium]